MRNGVRLAFIILMFPAILSAQERVSADAGPAFAIPLARLNGTKLTSGPGFAMSVAWRLQPHLHLYAGWDWIRLGADQCFAGTNCEFAETGYRLGLRCERPVRESSPLSIRAELGGTFKQVEIEDSGERRLASSGFSAGWEAGAGGTLEVFENLRLTAFARHRSATPEFVVGTARADGALRYLAIEFGLSRRF